MVAFATHVLFAKVPMRNSSVVYVEMGKYAPQKPWLSGSPWRKQVRPSRGCDSGSQVSSGAERYLGDTKAEGSKCDHACVFFAFVLGT